MIFQQDRRIVVAGPREGQISELPAETGYLCQCSFSWEDDACYGLPRHNGPLGDRALLYLARENSRFEHLQK